jgi:hypothetical protein
MWTAIEDRPPLTQNAGMTDERMNLSFDAIHDADAGVWVATSAVGKITTEAPSREALIERLKVIVPDVLESRLGHAPHDVSIVIKWLELRTVEQTELMVA